MPMMTFRLSLSWGMYVLGAAMEILGTEKLEGDPTWQVHRSLVRHS